MENRHTLEDLKEMQNYPLEMKIALTNDRIRAWYREYNGNVFVSRSGGKDSDVLGDIVKKLYPDVPQVFINTGLEWDSVRRHGMEVADEVLYPEINFVEVVKRYGYPVIGKEVAQRVCEARERPDGESARRFTDCEHNRKYPQFSMEAYAWLLDAPFKISHKCCKVMKKTPSKRYEKKTGRKPIVGTLADESRLRKSNWLRHGCNAFDLDRPVSAPLSFWTEQDILKYIKEYNVELADIYGDVIYDWENSEDVQGQLTISDIAGFEEEKRFDADKPLLKTTGCKRTGCMMCGFGCHLEKPGDGRFELLKKTHPGMYNLLDVIKNNGVTMREAIEWINKNGGFDIKL